MQSLYVQNMSSLVNYITYDHNLTQVTSFCIDMFTYNYPKYISSVIINYNLLSV